MSTSSALTGQALGQLELDEADLRGVAFGAVNESDEGPRRWKDRGANERRTARRAHLQPDSACSEPDAKLTDAETSAQADGAIDDALLPRTTTSVRRPRCRPTKLAPEGEDENRTGA